ncbi:hypothetical protein ABZ567_31305 [Streptomyces sp. NPDC016459]
MSPVSHALAVLVCALVAFSEAVAGRWSTFVAVAALGTSHLLALAKERP